MGEENLKKQKENLELQIVIASKIINVEQNIVFMDEIMEKAGVRNIDDEATRTAIRIMISHGIIKQGFSEGRMYFIITNFGRYFFNELYKNNLSFKELFKR